MEKGLVLSKAILMKENNKVSNLILHAEKEMRLAGLYDKDSDYGAMIPDAVMALVKAHSEQGHSGMSHAITLGIFNKVINFKCLTPISSNPDEWMQVGDDAWQNLRQCSVFSRDGGKTWYDLDEPKKTSYIRRILSLKFFQKMPIKSV